jgi:hypothetical protein
MAEKTEFLTILNLFKSDETVTREIANVLLKNRLSKITSLSFDRYFMNDLIEYLRPADHVPGKVHADIYNILTGIIVEDKGNITNVANRANSLLRDVAMLKDKNSQLEKEHDKMCLKYFLRHNISTDELDHDAFVTLDSLFEAYDNWTFKRCTIQDFKVLLEVVWAAEVDKGGKYFGIRLKNNKEENVVYECFVQNCIRPMTKPDGRPDISYVISSHSLFDIFKRWNRMDAYPGTEEILKASFEKIWQQEAVNTLWFGFKFIL